jgi:transitional endoplasmic reticulum ATPase
MSRTRVELHPLGDARAFQDHLLVAKAQPQATLRTFLTEWPAMSLQPLDGSVLDAPLRRLRVQVIPDVGNTPVFRPPVTWSLSNAAAGEHAAADASHTPVSDPVPTVPAPEATPSSGHGDLADLRPVSLDHNEAVRLAYAEDIERAASYLRSGLSVLVFCDKLVVRHLWPRIVSAAVLETLLLEMPAEDEGAMPLLQQGFRQRQLGLLRSLIANVKQGQVLVLPYLDLLGGGGERGLNPEARELIELLYDWPDRLLLAFADRSLPLADVLADRFAIRLDVSGLPREVPMPGGDRRLLGDALVTRAEASLFDGYEPRELFKNVAGLNPLRLRDAIAYAVQQAKSRGHSADAPAPVGLLYAEIRSFKAQTSTDFEIPQITMADIGGYDEVKAVLERALRLMAGAGHLPDERLRRELIPRGFLFHGPPGTGKTLIAKAVANRLNATIRVVSGPEVTDKYVGESERKVREIFAEARRNAPAVIVFDEFDAIATRRSSRDDGGSRAGNAMVAQILTEMDGFRPDVPMLVIGTTNQLKLIDEALLRPSRFQPVSIDLPDIVARRQIAEIHARHFQIDIAPELLDLVAEATDHMNGDQIRSIFRDACLGLHCDDPPAPVTPERIGFLVGRLKAAHVTQRLEQRGAREAQAATRPGPRRPSRAGTPLHRPQAPDSGPVPPVNDPHPS